MNTHQFTPLNLQWTDGHTDRLYVDIDAVSGKAISIETFFDPSDDLSIPSA